MSKLGGSGEGKQLAEKQSGSEQPPAVSPIDAHCGNGADHEDEVIDDTCIQLLNLRVAMKRWSWRNVIRSCMRRGKALLVCSIGRMGRKDGLQ